MFRYVQIVREFSGTLVLIEMDTTKVRCRKSKVEHPRLFAVRCPCRFVFSCWSRMSPLFPVLTEFLRSKASKDERYCKKMKILTDQKANVFLNSTQFVTLADLIFEFLVYEWPKECCLPSDGIWFVRMYSIHVPGFSLSQSLQFACISLFSSSLVASLLCYFHQPCRAWGLTRSYKYAPALALSGERRNQTRGSNNQLIAIEKTTRPPKTAE